MRKISKYFIAKKLFFLFTRLNAKIENFCVSLGALPQTPQVKRNDEKLYGSKNKIARNPCDSRSSGIVTSDKKFGGKVAHFLHPDIKSAWAGAKAHSPNFMLAIGGGVICKSSTHKVRPLR